MNRGLLFILGVAVGATGSALLLSPKTRPMLMETARGVMALGDKALERAEVLREDMEDFLAEARISSEEPVQVPKATKSPKKSTKKTVAKKTAPKPA